VGGSIWLVGVGALLPVGHAQVGGRTQTHQTFQGTGYEGLEGSESRPSLFVAGLGLFQRHALDGGTSDAGPACDALFVSLDCQVGGRTGLAYEPRALWAERPLEGLLESPPGGLGTQLELAPGQALLLVTTGGCVLEQADGVAGHRKERRLDARYLGKGRT